MLADLPEIIKKPTGLEEVFHDFPLQHVDLHITRCVRQLVMFSDDENELPEYPEELPSNYIITTMNQVWGDDYQNDEDNKEAHEDEADESKSPELRKDGFYLRCCSAFSPCYIEFTSDNSDEPNIGSSNVTEKE